jgi:hypothetical protein
MLRGGCLCGTVRFEAEGPQLFFAHCHCRWCRRAHGAGFVTWLGVREAGFRVVRGEERLKWYQSSARSRRGFCGECGSTLLFASRAAPGEMHLAAGCVDEGLEGEPRAHVFTDQKAPWITIADGLPQAMEGSPGLAAYRGDPNQS